MAKPRRYQFEQRSEGRGAAVRVGPTGGKKVVAVYTDQETADEVVRFLEARKNREA